MQTYCSFFLFGDIIHESELFLIFLIEALVGFFFCFLEYCICPSKLQMRK